MREIVCLKSDIGFSSGLLAWAKPKKPTLSLCVWQHLAAAGRGLASRRSKEESNGGQDTGLKGNWR